MLTRLNGEQFAINPDLLERVEATPDTILTLVDGTKYMVREPVVVVIREIRDFRASVVATARDLVSEPRLALAPVMDDAPAHFSQTTTPAPQADDIPSIHNLRRP